MRIYQHKNKQQAASKEQQTNPGFELTDNRPQAAVQRKLQQAADNSRQAVSNSRFIEMSNNHSPVMQLRAITQLARTKKTVKKGTVSGHGGLRRHPKTGALVPYKVPRGKKIVITAPPGATLGDISLLLNMTDNPDFVKIRKKVKISTNSDLWKNRTVISVVRSNNTIVKTTLQQKLLDDLDTSVRSYSDLSGSEKGSLTKLESKPEFEQWAESYVKPELFRVKSGGETMDDMILEPFEKKLRSSDDDTANQNDYIENKTYFSDYMKSNKDLTEVLINACSDDPTAESDYTGFQIDKK